MNKIILITALLLTAFITHAQHLYVAKNANISFYSSTPVEDIDALCNNANTLINSEGAVAFILSNTAFVFKNKLMQEHFNEKYMESEKYPMSSFKGKINEKIDFNVDGIYQVTATGLLNIHGVEKERTIAGVITIKNGNLHIVSDFKVRVADHKIEIPRLVLTKIAEEIDVKVVADLQPKNN